MAIITRQLLKKNARLISLILVVILSTLLLSSVMGFLSMLSFGRTPDESGIIPGAPEYDEPNGDGDISDSSGPDGIPNGVNGSGGIPAETIPCEGGDCGKVLLFEVYGETQTNYLRRLVGEVYENEQWSISSDYESYGYDGNEIRNNVVRFTGSVESQFDVKPIEEMRGYFPVSLYTSKLSFFDSSPTINFMPQQQIFYSEDEFYSQYSVFHTGYIFDDALLRNSELDSNQRYLQLPENLKNRIAQLAREICNQENNPYDQIVAIKEYLQTNYVYDKNYTRAPSGWDPIEWFLFEEKRGVCANFNSAFVALMRACDIPSRVVAGYAINGETDFQQVYSCQSHAWAEVKFEELGWVEFDATGAGICDCYDGVKDGTGEPKEPTEPEDQETEIECRISAEGGDNPHVLVFEVYGATGSPYLRSQVGEEYSEGSWEILPGFQVVDYSGGQLIPKVDVFSNRVDFGFAVDMVYPGRGFFPTVLHTTGVSFIEEIDMKFLPDHEIFFASNRFQENYNVYSTHYEFGEELLKGSDLYAGVKLSNYLQLPENLRVKAVDLLKEKGLFWIENPYDRIINIRDFLRSEYVYDKNYTRAPSGWDPIEWFLFEEKRGVCANFNSAFVTLMRACEIPSRIVSGFSVNNQVEYQEVFGDQSHAWAEVFFDSLGWVEFDATGSGGNQENPDEVVKPLQTFTEITYVQSPVIKGSRFPVEGMVIDENGNKVDGIAILVHLKVNKDDESGTLIGEGKVENGNFLISCIVPLNYTVGNYNVIAIAIPNQQYLGSDSDPVIKIRSETSIALSAPQWAIDGRNFEIFGQVQEKESGDPVSFATLRIKIGSKDLGEIITDQNGDFWLASSITNVGEHVIYANSLESEYFLPSQEEVNIEIYAITLDLDIPENATRLEDVMLACSLSAGEHAISGEGVQILFDDKIVSTSSSDEEGKIRTEYVVPSSQDLGEKTVIFRLTDYHATENENTTVFAKSYITLENWEKNEDEDVVYFEAKLENDLDEPVANVNIVLECSGEKFEKSTQAFTGSNGDSNLEIGEVPASFRGLLNYSLVFDGYDYILPSISSGEIVWTSSFVSPNWFESPFLFIMPTIVIVAGGIFLVMKKRKQALEQTVKPKKIFSPKPGIKTTSNSLLPQTSLEVLFPQIFEPLPDVWGLNEKLTVDVLLKQGNNPVKGVVKLSFDHGDQKDVQTGDFGSYSFDKIIGQKGFHLIEVGFVGDERFQSCKTERTVKIVDYKEEIVEVFNTLFSYIRTKGVPLFEKTTPREFEKLVVEKFGDVDRDSLDDFVSVFEIANYSLHSLGRREYERVYLAYLSLQNLKRKGIEVTV